MFIRLRRWLGFGASPMTVPEDSRIEIPEDADDEQVLLTVAQLALERDEPVLAQRDGDFLIIKED